MTNQVEIKERKPKEEPQQTYAEEIQRRYIDKLVASMCLEIKIGYSTTYSCASRLEEELYRPGYSPEVRTYIQYRLDGIVDDTVDNEIDAYLDRVEREMEMEEMGIMGPYFSPAPEDYPEYPELVRLWGEVRELEQELADMQ